MIYVLVGTGLLIGAAEAVSAIAVQASRPNTAAVTILVM